MSSASNNKGLTLIELVIALAVLAILASVVIPLSEVTVTRVKEVELRRALRDIREAIDAYKEDYELAVEKRKFLLFWGKAATPKN